MIEAGRPNAVERSFHHALAALRKIESRAPQPGELARQPDPQAPASDPEPPPDQSLSPGIGFVPSNSPEPVGPVARRPDMPHSVVFSGIRLPGGTIIKPTA
jgi:hypothetical protein